MTKASSCDGSPRRTFTCALCVRAGRATLAPRAGQRSICEDCAAWLASTGRGWCNRGGHVVPAVELRARGAICRACDNARRQAQYRANAERERAAQRERYRADPARHIARSTAWRHANPERSRAYHREHRRVWRRANPGRELAARRRYVARHRERVRAQRQEQYRRRLLKILRGATTRRGR